MIVEHSHIHKILFSPIKQIMWQFKLCGNHLVNMLGLVCGNFGGQGAFGAKVKAAQKNFFSGMAAFLEESFDPFSYDVNSKVSN